MTRTTRADDHTAKRGPAATSAATTRREFLEGGARAVGTGIAAWVLWDLTGGTDAAAAVGRGTGTSIDDYDWNNCQYVYLVDVRKCIGCGACVRACSRENEVPDHYFRTWVERYQVSRIGEPQVDSPNGGMDGFRPLATDHEVTKAFFFPKLCCHCTYTPCVQLCPVGASYRTRDGVVLVDEKRCIGCGYCVQGCPYGSRFIHPRTHVASKCTLCYHRLRRGLQTACIESCPVGARMIGNAREVGDKVAEIIATEQVQILQPELLTHPNCYYLGLSSEAR